VNGIVQSGGAPVEVSEGIIQGIKTWLSQDQQVEAPVARPGEVVLITSGVMSGIEAVFVREMSDRERVEVLLSVLHCGARMIVSRDDVRRVS
jgi:transcription antitermination factor NusG